MIRLDYSDETKALIKDFEADLLLQKDPEIYKLKLALILRSITDTYTGVKHARRIKKDVTISAPTYVSE